MEFQAEILKVIQSFHTPLLDGFFILITNLGSEAFYFALIPVIYWSRDKKLGLGLGSALIISMYTNVVLKEITAIPRPIGYPGIRSLYTLSAGGFSFPSGHAQGSATLWSILMRRYNTCRAYVLGTGIIFIVSLSRLYLGLHWPLDVIGGIILGVFTAFIFLRIEKTKIPSNAALQLVFSVAFPLVLLKIFPHHDVYKYTGMLMGIWLGAIFENKFIDFQPENRNFFKTALKYTAGLTGFLAVYLGLKILLPPLDIFSMLRYFLLGLWLVAGAPFIFKKFEL
ncbi:phosphatase PAP2 family protein [Thermoanaerobacterium sp. DL9XJH110]|uniref:phosphatase PAP2 family protein n=1 Tax=Thermoanaerobacterium sp. DL9XJH110 TaxID=3386643 RepID=UPI003BB61184